MNAIKQQASVVPGDAFTGMQLNVPPLLDSFIPNSRSCIKVRDTNDVPEKSVRVRVKAESSFPVSTVATQSPFPTEHHK